jgi:hypothetical protein
LFIKGLKSTDALYISSQSNGDVNLNGKQFQASVAVTRGAGEDTEYVLIYDDSDITEDITIRIKKELTTTEYIDRVYKLEPGQDNYIYMVTLGFFETDRDELNSIVNKTLNKLNRPDGSLKEIKLWLVKALKNIHESKN